MKLTTIIYSSILKIIKILPFKKELFSAIKLSKVNLDKFHMDLKFNGSFQVKEADVCFSLTTSGNETLENMIFWKGLYSINEKISLSIWNKLVPDKEVILDIGANTGIYSLCAASINNKAKIIGFEPSKNVFKKLLKNVENNDFDIECHEIALSNENGNFPFYDFSTEHQYSASLNKNMILSDEYKIVNTVKTQRLDSFIEKNKISKIDLIKIDAEMHEPEIIEGLGIYLNKFQPDFLVEILTDDMAGKLSQIFEGTNYLFYDIIENKGLTQKNRLEKSSCFNYLICKPETAEFLNLLS